MNKKAKQKNEEYKTPIFKIIQICILVLTVWLLLFVIAKSNDPYKTDDFAPVIIGLTSMLIFVPNIIIGTIVILFKAFKDKFSMAEFSIFFVNIFIYVFAMIINMAN